MKFNRFIAYPLFLAFVILSCYHEEVILDGEPERTLELPLILKINNKNCCLDAASNSLRYPIDHDSIDDFTPLIDFQEYTRVLFDNLQLINHTTNNLGLIKTGVEYNLTLITGNTTNKLKLTFTNLPVVQIITASKIWDEPKTPACITINYPSVDEESLSSYIGIEHRGNTSQFFPKRSYGFSFLSSMNTQDKVSRSVFGFNGQVNWILDAMYIDRSRMKNRISFLVWRQMNPVNYYGINSELVELYLNNEHWGLYCLNENIDPEFLDLKDPGAILYKATEWDNGTNFRKYKGKPPVHYYWEGWEQIYPDPDHRIDWEPMARLRDLASNSSDSRFIHEIGSLLDIDNFIDYYILMNLISGRDNLGKNMFLIRRNTQDKLNLIPWDMDNTWATNWDSVLTNPIYDRLLTLNPGYFKSKLKTRWIKLRHSVFSKTELESNFRSDFQRIDKSGVIDLENVRWNLDINTEEEYNYIIDWLTNRLQFLDAYFSSL